MTKYIFLLLFLSFNSHTIDYIDISTYSHKDFFQIATIFEPPIEIQEINKMKFINRVIVDISILKKSLEETFTYDEKESKKFDIDQELNDYDYCKKIYNVLTEQVRFYNKNKPHGCDPINLNQYNLAVLTYDIKKEFIQNKDRIWRKRTK